MINSCLPFGWRSSPGWVVVSAAIAYSHCNTSQGGTIVEMESRKVVKDVKVVPPIQVVVVTLVMNVGVNNIMRGML